MKRIIALIVAAIAALTLIPAPVSAGSNVAEINNVATSCAAPDGTYTVTWRADIFAPSRVQRGVTAWSLTGTAEVSVASSIYVVTTHSRITPGFPVREPRIAIQAQIGSARPILTDDANIPAFCP